MIVAAASLLSAACASILGLDNGTPQDTGIDASRDQTNDLTIDNSHGDGSQDVVGQDYDLDVPMSDGNIGDGCTIPPDACGVFCGTVNGCGQTIDCPPCDAACEGSTIYACNGRACGAFPDNCGAQTDCGTCSGMYSLCVDDGSCCADPNACVNQGAQCFFVSNGCDGVPCGTCDAGYQCNNGTPPLCILNPQDAGFDGGCNQTGTGCCLSPDCCSGSCVTTTMNSARPLQLPPPAAPQCSNNVCVDGGCTAQGGSCGGPGECCAPSVCTVHPDGGFFDAGFFDSGPTCQ